MVSFPTETHCGTNGFFQVIYSKKDHILYDRWKAKFIIYKNILFSEIQLENLKI